jgi:hypothetical protein
MKMPLKATLDQLPVASLGENAKNRNYRTCGVPPKKAKVSIVKD